MARSARGGHGRSSRARDGAVRPGGRGDRRAARRPLGGVLFGGAFEDRLPRRSPDASSLTGRPSSRTTSSAAAARPRPPRRRPPGARGWRRWSASPRPARSSPGGCSWRATSSAAASRCASRPGSVQRGDHVSPRNGVASLSLAGEPLAGWRPIDGTEHRRRTDGAGLIRALLEGRYREAHEASAQLDASRNLSNAGSATC